jgi:hypothetical protein
MGTSKAAKPATAPHGEPTSDVEQLCGPIDSAHTSGPSNQQPRGVEQRRKPIKAVVDAKRLEEAACIKRFAKDGHWKNREHQALKEKGKRNLPPKQSGSPIWTFVPVAEATSARTQEREGTWVPVPRNGGALRPTRGGA